MRVASLRRGTSLIELLVALTIFGIFAAIVLALLRTNGRSMANESARLESRAALWQGSAVIATELRPIAPPAGDILMLSDSAAWYRSFAASGVTCAASSAATIDLLPDSLSSGARPATGWTSVQPGDLLFVWDEGPRLGASDDQWRSMTVASVSGVPGLCDASSLVDSTLDVGRSGTRVRLTAPMPTPIAVGAAVRATRPARLALYRSGAAWYLGWSDWNSALNAWNVIQPVSGPYRSYAPAPLAGGLQFAAFDSSGTRLLPASMQAAAAVEFHLRTSTISHALGVGAVSQTRTDSLRTVVGVRNGR